MLIRISGLLRDGVLRTLYRFVRDGVRDRFDEIFFTQEVLISLLLGIGFFQWGYKWCLESAKLTDFALGFLGYAAIALGFSVGATTVALTLPERTFMNRMVLTERKNKPGDALSGLLFVFCWTAVIHWFVIALLVSLLIAFGHREAAFFANSERHFRVIGGCLVCFCAYALLQFLITVLTLWQVGIAFILELKKQANSK